MTDAAEYNDARQRFERTDRFVRRLQIAVLAFGAVLYLVASIAIFSSLGGINSDVSLIKTRQTENHALSVTQQQELAAVQGELSRANKALACQDQAFDIIQGEINDSIKGVKSKPMSLGAPC